MQLFLRQKLQSCISVLKVQYNYNMKSKILLITFLNRLELSIKHLIYMKSTTTSPKTEIDVVFHKFKLNAT